MEAVKDTPKLYRLRMYFDVVLVRLFGNTNVCKVSDFANIAGIFFTLYILFKYNSLLCRLEFCTVQCYSFAYSILIDASATTIRSS